MFVCVLRGKVRAMQVVVCCLLDWRMLPSPLWELDLPLVCVPISVHYLRPLSPGRYSGVHIRASSPRIVRATDVKMVAPTWHLLYVYATLSQYMYVKLDVIPKIELFSCQHILVYFRCSILNYYNFGRNQHLTYYFF